MRLLRLVRRNSISGQNGYPTVPTYPPLARFRPEDGRPGVVRHAADIQLGIAGNADKFSAIVLDADIPALLRKRATEALCGELAFPRDALELQKQG